MRGMHDKPSVFSSRYLGRNGCQADYEKHKITLSQRLSLKYHAAAWDNILWTLALECGPSSFYRSIASYRSPLFVEGIILRSPASFTWNNNKGETLFGCKKKMLVVWL